MRETLSIVIPAYNEEENIRELYRQLKEVLSTLPLKSAEIIFVDDGSRDLTFLRCQELQKGDASIKIVRLMRNSGHEIAMTAGMDHASGEAVLFMDADLQHPPLYIPEMVRLWQAGKDIVLTRRKDNPSTSGFYRFCARNFYRLLNFLSDVKVPKNMPDFRLIDQKYINHFKKFDERDFLFRGMLCLVMRPDNPKVAFVDFVANHRFAGTTKYNFFKCLKLAINSIVQFSVRPLYLSLWLAALSGLLALMLGGVAIIEYFVMHSPTPGYTTIVSAVVFMGAMNLFVLAIIGIYIGKIHMETKKRPLYFAELITQDSFLNGAEEKNGAGIPCHAGPETRFTQAPCNQDPVPAKFFREK